MFNNKTKFIRKKRLSYISLSDSEIMHIHNKAKQASIFYSESNKTSSGNMAGDLQSRVRGAGVDFEENKPYESGSDSRHINWRTFARTQQLYVNIYNEDKRPSTYIVLDKRQSMYFGTRHQLKIKQALNLAIYSILRAMYQQQKVSGVEIASKPKWHSTYSGSNPILSFIEELNAPIQQQNISGEPALNDILAKLQLAEGSEVIIISDFHDMDKQTITSLYNYSRKYKIRLLRIQDPIEINLPQQGQYNIQANGKGPSLNIDCNNNDFTSAYNTSIKDKFSDYYNQCSNIGVDMMTYLTTDEIFED